MPHPDIFCSESCEFHEKSGMVAGARAVQSNVRQALAFITANFIRQSLTHWVWPGIWPACGQSGRGKERVRTRIALRASIIVGPPLTPTARQPSIDISGVPPSDSAISPSAMPPKPTKASSEPNQSILAGASGS